ncbi:MAG TPA: class I SAM-dependent methyltransferase [Streptosporangiaceae bacterium]|jgi:ubiquinone/menaquinone biosynthesis C-methylase UbiE
MNENHAKVCPSPEWAEHMQREVLPSLTEHTELGDEMLEIGPGPGAATDWLRHRVKRLTALEVEPAAAGQLADKYAGGNVEVVTGDATALGYPGESFDSVGTFTMLHHVPTVALQNKILAEAFRVLRPGGVLLGSDSLASNDLHHFHVDDTYNPVEPGSLLTRLQTIGFGKITITVDEIVTFIAHKPDGEAGCGAGGEQEDQPETP